MITKLPIGLTLQTLTLVPMIPMTCTMQLRYPLLALVLVTMCNNGLALSGCIKTCFPFVTLDLILLTIVPIVGTLTMLLPLEMCMPINLRGQSAILLVNLESPPLARPTMPNNRTFAKRLLLAAPTLRKIMRLDRLLFKPQLPPCTLLIIQWLLIRAPKVATFLVLIVKRKFRPSTIAEMTAPRPNPPCLPKHPL